MLPSRVIGSFSLVRYALLLVFVLWGLITTRIARADSPVFSHVQTIVGPVGVAPDLADGRFDNQIHPTGMAWSPDGQFLYLTDSNSRALLVLRRNSTTGALKVIDTFAGFGLRKPSSVVVSPDGQHIYVGNADGSDNRNVLIFRRGAEDGLLTYVATAYDTLSEVNALVISPDGKHVYEANEHNFLIYARDSVTGKLTHITEATSEYHAAVISADGRYLYRIDYDHRLEVLARDSTTGLLTLVERHFPEYDPFDQTTFCSMPSCVLVLSVDGRSLYLAGEAGEVIVFQRDLNSGRLTLVEYETNGLRGTNLAVDVYDLQLSADGRALYLAGVEYQYDTNGNVIAHKSVLIHFGRNVANGALDLVQIYRPETHNLPELQGVSQLLFTPDNSQLYAAGMALARFTRDTASGALTFSTAERFAYAHAGFWRPGHSTISPDGKYLYVTATGEELAYNSMDDSLTVLERDATTGALKVVQVVRGRYCSPYLSCTQDLLMPTSSAVSPDGKHLYVTHYWSGYTTFARDSRGLLTFVEEKRYDNTNPQTLTNFWNTIVSPDGKFVYMAVGKWDSAATNWIPTIMVLARNATTGALTMTQTKTVPIPGLTESASFYGLVISPDGKNLYATTIGGHALVVFTRNQTSGSLSLVELLQDGVNGISGLNWPENVVISADGKNVYVQDRTHDHGPTIFTRNSSTGKLTLLPPSSVIGGSLWATTDLVMSQDGSRVYVTGSLLTNNNPEAPETRGAVGVYARNSSTGALQWLGVQVDDVGTFTELFGSYALSLSPDDQHLYMPSKYDDSITVLAAPGATAHFGHIYGQVTNPRGEPIDNVVATAYSDPDGDGIWSVAGYGITDRTDYGASQTNGLYSISGLPPGEYRVHFAQQDWTPAHLPEFYVDAATLATATPVIIPAAGVAVPLDAQLGTRSGQLRGVVTDAKTGVPLAGVTVKVFRLRDGGGWQELIGASTDASGAYTVTVPDPVAYHLQFALAPTHRAEYYNNAADLAHSTGITAVSNTLLTGFDVELTPYASIRGTLTNPGASSIDATVTVYQDRNQDGVWDTVGWTYATKAGFYQVFGLEAGIYRLSVFNSDMPYVFHREYYDNAAQLEKATNIVLDESEVKTIDIRLFPSDSKVLAAADAVVVSAGGTANRLSNGQSSLLHNDDGPPGAVLTATLVSGPQHGVLTLQPNGTFTYTHDGSEGSSDFFTYQALHSLAESTVATVTITITAVADPPLAQADQINVAQGAIVSQLAAGGNSVLHNDTDPKGRVLTVQLVTAPSYGQLTLRSDGTFSYQHDGSPNSSDSFSYRASNGSSTSQPVIVTITIAPVSPANQPPAAQPDSIIVAHQGSVQSLSNGSTSLLTNDQDPEQAPLQAILVTPPQHGLLTLQANGTFHYTHDGSPTATDSFTYRASDGSALSPVAMVTITITPVSPPNQPPTAQPDSIIVAHQGSVQTLANGSTSLLANDQDPEQSPLQAILVTPPQHGQLTLQPDGTFAYAHDGSPTATDSFTYRASDGRALSPVMMVTITITAPATPGIHFVFGKTAGIAGITPLCSNRREVKVPRDTTVVYCYTIRNTGTVTLTTHSLIDSHLGQLLDQATQLLPPGATITQIATQTLTLSTTNVATWTATADSANLGLAVSSVPESAAITTAATVIISAGSDDQDQDTIPDNVEGAQDVDGDNLPNFLDEDADGDSQLDHSEAGSDPLHPVDGNNNGLADYLEGVDDSGTSQRVYMPVISKPR